MFRNGIVFDIRLGFIQSQDKSFKFWLDTSSSLAKEFLPISKSKKKVLRKYFRFFFSRHNDVLL